jgi:hypothetical protein
VLAPRSLGSDATKHPIVCFTQTFFVVQRSKDPLQRRVAVPCLPPDEPRGNWSAPQPPHRLSPPSPHAHPPQQLGHRDVERKQEATRAVSEPRADACALAYSRHSYMRPLIHAYTRVSVLLSAGRVCVGVCSFVCVLVSAASYMPPLIHEYTLTRTDAYTFSLSHAGKDTRILEASTLTYKHLRLTRTHTHTRWRTHTGWIALRQRENL